MTSVRGRVIRILSPQAIVINLGSEHGIERGSQFRILGTEEPVTDPQTQEVLGRVLIVKAKVSAQNVYQKFTIATTKWEELELPSALSQLGLEPLRHMLRRTTVDEGDLRVLKQDMEPWKAQSEEPVRVGDFVEVNVIEPSPTTESDETTPEQS